MTSAEESQPAATPAANGSPSPANLAAFDSPACEHAARDLAQAAAGAWHAKLGDVLARPRASTGQERAVYRFDFYALAAGKDIAPYRASDVMGLGSIDVDPSSGGIELHCVARLDCSAWDEPKAQPVFAELRARVVQECGRPGRAEPAFGAPARAAERARRRDAT